jgi:MFS family permease
MEHVDDRKKGLIMRVVMYSLLFAALNTTMTATAMPQIVQNIGGLNYFHWVFVIYMLCSSVTAIFSGKLTNRYGLKALMLAGLTIFALGSLLAGYASTMVHLILFRAIQGVGGGMIISAAFAITGQLFYSQEKERWQGKLGAMIGIASVFGPVLGGYIVETYLWSWLFWISVPVAVLSIAVVWQLYPRGFQEQKKEPAANPGSLKRNLFGLIYTLHFLVGMGMFGVVLFIPFYVQGVIGRSALVSGLVELVMTVSMVLSSAVAGILIARIGKYKMIALNGLTMMALGIFLNTMLTVDSDLWNVMLNMTVVGFGLGATFPAFSHMLQHTVPPQYLAQSTAASQVSRELGGTFGVAVMGTVMASLLTTRLAGSETQSPAAVLTEWDNPVVQQALSDVLSEVFLFAAIFVVVAIVLSFTLRDRSARR